MNSAPLPWFSYVGGNFIKIGTEGYNEHVDREHYLAGPFCVGKMECNATTDHKYDMPKAIANTEVLLISVNTYPGLLDALSRIASGTLSEKEACITARAALGIAASTTGAIKKKLGQDLSRLVSQGLSHAA